MSRAVRRRRTTELERASCDAPSHLPTVHRFMIRFLRSLMLFGETRLGLPYSLWALQDQSGLPGCLVWSVGHWRTPVYRSSSLKFGRYTTNVKCRDPPLAADRHRSTHARLHSPPRAPAIAPATIPTSQTLVPTIQVAGAHCFCGIYLTNMCTNLPA